MVMKVHGPVRCRTLHGAAGRIDWVEASTVAPPEVAAALAGQKLPPVVYQRDGLIDRRYKEICGRGPAVAASARRGMTSSTSHNCLGMQVDRIGSTQ
jgi:hypothetical protein